MNSYAEGDQFFADNVAAVQTTTHKLTVEQTDKPASKIEELVGPQYSATRNA